MITTLQESQNFKITWYRLLDVSSNKFTFEDLLPLYQSKLNSSAEFYYSPQRDFNVGNRYYLNPGSRHTMTVSIDGSVANNRISWLRNNSNVGNGKDCSIQSFNNSIHGGVYSSIVENAELPSLKLNVNHDTLACLPQTGIYNLTLCENKFVDIHGRRFDVNHASDSILLMGFSQNACDSLVLVHVEILKILLTIFIVKFVKGCLSSGMANCTLKGFILNGWLIREVAILWFTFIWKFRIKRQCYNSK